MDESDLLSDYIKLTQEGKKLYVHFEHILYLTEVSARSGGGTQIRLREDGCVKCDEHIDTVLSRIKGD